MNYYSDLLQQQEQNTLNPDSAKHLFKMDTIHTACVAIAEKNEEIFKILLDKSLTWIKNTGYLNDHDTKEALHVWAMECSFEGWTDGIEMILRNTSNFPKEWADGIWDHWDHHNLKTPLSQAARFGFTDIVRLIAPLANYDHQLRVLEKILQDMRHSTEICQILWSSIVQIPPSPQQKLLINFFPYQCKDPVLLDTFLKTISPIPSLCATIGVPDGDTKLWEQLANPDTDPNMLVGFPLSSVERIQKNLSEQEFLMLDHIHSYVRLNQLSELERRVYLEIQPTLMCDEILKRCPQTQAALSRADLEEQLPDNLARMSKPRKI